MNKNFIDDINSRIYYKNLTEKKKNECRVNFGRKRMFWRTNEKNKSKWFGWR